jgi:sugar phosphate permease
LLKRAQKEISMTESSPGNQRIFYGWYIVGVSFLIMAIAGGSGATFPLFLVALTDEFGWSQASLGGTVSAGMIVGGLVTPFWGKWTDRSGARVVVVTATAVTGLSVFLRAYMTSLAHLYLLSAGGALFAAGMGLIPLSTAISKWFVKKRGIAMGITLVGGGLGASATPPIANYLIETTGWRNTYMMLAAILWIGIIPTAGLILRRSPEDLGLLPDGESPKPEPQPTAAENEEPAALAKSAQSDLSEDFTPKQAMRTLAFWMISIAFLLPMMTGVGLITHLVAIFENLGETSRTASICLGLIGGLSVVGRLSFGFMADRFSVRKIFTACYIMETIAVSTLLATALIGAKALFVFILIYGLTGGGGLVLAPLLISECFGLKSMGTIFGMLAIAAVIGGATGAVLVGRIVDTTGNYYLAFIIFTIGEAIAATAISQARSPMKGR